MALFQYSGRNNLGKLVEGALDGASVDAIAGQLASRGITPIKIEVAQEKVDIIETLNEIFGTNKVNPQELVILCRQMYSINKAGVPLIRGLKGISESSQNPALKVALEDIAERLAAGSDFTAALRQHPRIFNHLFVSIIQVGETSGNLDGAFDQLSGYITKDIETQKKMKTAFRYPTFVLMAVTAAIIIINVFVVPEFAKFFDRFGADLPLPTIILITSSNFLLNYWQYLIVGVAASVYSIRAYLNTEAGAYMWGHWKLRMPIVGDIIDKASLARYTRSLSMMMQSGVPLVQALDLCAFTIDNPYLGKKINTIKAGVERGESLMHTHTQSDMFTPLVLQMIAVGEESGQVDPLLLEVAGFYEEEVEYNLSNMAARIEPILVVIMAGMVLVLALGIFLPMWSLGSAMTGGG